MKNGVKVALVGAGKRVNALYLDVLKRLQEEGQLEVSGIQNRTRSKAESLATVLRTKVYDSLDDVLRDPQVEAVLLTTSTDVKDLQAMQILRSKKHLFLETPLSYSLAQGQKIAKLSKEFGCIVEISEDEAFWQVAGLQKLIIESGELGRVTLVQNDGLEYYYHALARLSVLLGTKLKASEYFSKNMNVGGKSLELREVKFEDGLVYISKYSGDRRGPLYLGSNWKVYCEKGYLDQTGGCFETSAGVFERFEYEVGPQGLQATLAAKKITWQSPFTGFTGHSLGIATLLARFCGSIRTQAPVLYGVERALQDIEIWKTMERAKASFLLNGKSGKKILNLLQTLRPL